MENIRDLDLLIVKYILRYSAKAETRTVMIHMARHIIGTLHPEALEYMPILSSWDIMQNSFTQFVDGPSKKGEYEESDENSNSGNPF